MRCEEKSGKGEVVHFLHNLTIIRSNRGKVRGVEDGRESKREQLDGSGD